MTIISCHALLLLVVLTTTLWSSSAQQSKIFPYSYEEVTLDNGLKVVVLPTDYPSLVSFRMVVRVGSRNEEPGLSGFAHMFEHMMFKGTPNITATEYTGNYSAMGATLNAYTSNDVTVYLVNFMKENLERVMSLEADRFMYSNYSEALWKTEAGAVVGEYNLRTANNPVSKLMEVQRNVTFTAHPYKYNVLGSLVDIYDMPNEYEYSRIFFDRYYRPEYTTMLIAGDLNVTETIGLVRQYFDPWEGGTFTEDVPQDPAPTTAVYDHLPFHLPTLPMISVAFRAPAFSDTTNDMATLDLISTIAFSSSSDLYAKLVFQEQKAESLFVYGQDSRDPFLWSIYATVKDIADVWYVRDEIMKTLASLRVEAISTRRLEEVKSNLKYRFSLGMDSTDNMVSTLSHYLAMTGDPESVNRVYQMYDSVTPDDILEDASTYFTDSRMTVVSMATATDTLPEIDDKVGSVDQIVKNTIANTFQVKKVLDKTDSPIIDMRIAYNLGSSDDPVGKEGLAQLTASMISSAGSESTSYAEIRKQLFPLAGSFGGGASRDQTTFSGRVHVDNADDFFDIVSEQLLTPGFDEEDFVRIKAEMTNSIVDHVRTSDNGLAQAVLYDTIYEGHPYSHLTIGTVGSIESLTLDDVKSFYKTMYTRDGVTLGLSGNFSDPFLARVNAELSKFDISRTERKELPEPSSNPFPRAVIIEQDTRSTTIAAGFPVGVTKAHPDFVPLLVASTYYGGGMFTARLMKRIRADRGINYGNYATAESSPTMPQREQIMAVSIYPTDSIEVGHFATRVAMFELDKLIQEGMTEEDFESVRTALLSKIYTYVDTQGKRLNYLMASEYYGIEEFTSYITSRLNNTTVDDVNAAVDAHLKDQQSTFVFVTSDASALKSRLLNETTSVMTYPSEKPADLLEEDKTIQDYKLGFREGSVTIVSASGLFEGVRQSSDGPAMADGSTGGLRGGDAGATTDGDEETFDSASTSAGKLSSNAVGWATLLVVAGAVVGGILF